MTLFLDARKRKKERGKGGDYRKKIDGAAQDFLPLSLPLAPASPNLFKRRGLKEKGGTPRLSFFFLFRKGEEGEEGRRFSQTTSSRPCRFRQIPGGESPMRRRRKKPAILFHFYPEKGKKGRRRKGERQWLVHSTPYA